MILPWSSGSHSKPRGVYYTSRQVWVMQTQHHLKRLSLISTILFGLSACDSSTPPRPDQAGGETAGEVAGDTTTQGGEDVGIEAGEPAGEDAGEDAGVGPGCAGRRLLLNGRADRRPVAHRARNPEAAHGGKPGAHHGRDVIAAEGEPQLRELQARLRHSAQLRAAEAVDFGVADRLTEQGRGGGAGETAVQRGGGEPARWEERVRVAEESAVQGGEVGVVRNRRYERGVRLVWREECRWQQGRLVRHGARLLIGEGREQAAAGLSIAPGF